MHGPLGLVSLGSDHIDGYRDSAAGTMQGARFESGLDNSPMYGGREASAFSLPPLLCAPPATPRTQPATLHSQAAALHTQVRWRLLRGERLVGRRVRSRADASL